MTQLKQKAIIPDSNIVIATKKYYYGFIFTQIWYTKLPEWSHDWKHTQP